MNIIENIKKYANKNPERIAYIINGETLTYEELENTSNRLASRIQQEAKEDKTPIIVYGHKNKYMLVSFLACVKSGRAYCPIDISVPIERTKMILQTVKPKVILATEELNIRNENVWRLEDIKKYSETCEDINEEHLVKNSDTFYIIFTSGSTGTPKGVQITMECLDNFLKWSSNFKGIEEKEGLTFINQAPFSFDLSVMDLYTCLATGGTLFALDKKAQNNMSEMFELLKKSNANVWVSTPSFVNMCLADKLFNKELLPQMNTFLFCGEILPNITANKLLDRFDSVNVINTYGPTESTVAVTSVLVTKEMINNTTSLPVGKTKPGTNIFIRNEDNKNLSDGEKGEIIIVGDTVSTGYFKNEEKTRKAFDTCKIDNKEYRAYKTGDLGYIKDEQLYYCGRIDFQIKLHGYRIEIEDIENNILKHLDIKNVAVIPQYESDQITVKYLKAFIETNNKIDNNLEETIKIKDKLKEYLPNYMIPKKITFIDKIPMTNNSKIDRKALRGM